MPDAVDVLDGIADLLTELLLVKLHLEKERTREVLCEPLMERALSLSVSEVLLLAETHPVACDSLRLIDLSAIPAAFVAVQGDPASQPRINRAFNPNSPWSCVYLTPRLHPPRAAQTVDVCGLLFFPQKERGKERVRERKRNTLVIKPLVKAQGLDPKL